MSKLPHIGTTIFSVMSQLAVENNALNLSQGFPNFPIDERLTTIVQQIATEAVHQYLPMAGYPPLLEKIGRQVKDSYQRTVDSPTEILITAGATQGIFTTIQALVEPGQEVVILDPSYDCYEPAIILAGGIPKRVSLSVDFLPDWTAIEDAFSQKTKMLVINNPHNPSGKTWNPSDFERLELLLAQYPKVLLLSDEVYEYITFEKKHTSINSITSLRNKSIIISSFGKTFHITGWKIGYLIAPQTLMEEIKKIHQFLVFSVNSVAQVALSNYLDLVNVQELSSFYQEKRDLFRSLLSNSKFELLPCEGTYFQVASYRSISPKNDIEFTKQLVIEHGVAAIPMSVFCAQPRNENLIRFCFAKDSTTLVNAAKLLCKI
jgi:methionine transaminase